MEVIGFVSIMIEIHNELNVPDLTKTPTELEQKLESLHRSIHAKLNNVFECLKNTPDN